MEGMGWDGMNGGERCDRSLLPKIICMCAYLVALRYHDYYRLFQDCPSGAVKHNGYYQLKPGATAIMLKKETYHHTPLNSTIIAIAIAVICPPSGCCSTAQKGFGMDWNDCTYTYSFICTKKDSFSIPRHQLNVSLRNYSRANIKSTQDKSRSRGRCITSTFVYGV
jgi:hypothetical protein